MNLQGIVGPQSAQSIQPGTPANMRLGQLSDVVVSELHGRYYEGSYRGTRFGGANQAATATTAAFATTYTGLVLYNPNGTKVNLVLEKIGIAFVLAQTTATAFGIMIGQSTTAFAGVTALTPKSKNVGSGIQPVGLIASAATLPIAPTLDTILGMVDTGAVTVSTGIADLFDVEGSIVLPPGAFAAVYTTTATVASSFLASMQWEEVPV